MPDSLITAAAEKVGIPETELTHSDNGDGIVAINTEIPSLCVVLGEAVVCGDPSISNIPNTFVEIKDQAIVYGGEIGPFARVSGDAVIKDGGVVPAYAHLVSGVLIGELPVIDAGRWKAGLCAPNTVWIGCKQGDKEWWDANLESVAAENDVGDQVEYYREIIANLLAAPSPFEEV